VQHNYVRRGHYPKVFPSPDGTILDPDNLYHRNFVPILAAPGIRKTRLHHLRHSFGSQLIQNGASIVYVKEQMGHSSIQVTVDIYGHLIPGANVSFVDRHDEKAGKKPRSNRQPSAAPRNYLRKRHHTYPRMLLI
jgi:integrase